MFQLTIKNQNISESFDSRDKLIMRLETENKRVTTEKLEAICQIVQTNKDGEVIDKIGLDLPLLHQGLDEALLNFGKGKSRLPNPIPQKKVKEVKEATKPTNEEIKPEQQEQLEVQVPKRKTSFLSLVSVLICLSALCLSMMTFLSTQKQAQEIASFKTAQKAPSKPKGDDVGARDVFCRYFLPNYYSGKNSQLSDFIASTAKIDSQEGILQSVLLESHKTKDGQMILTYVIALKEKEEVIKKRISLSVKKQANSHYGYVVTKSPKTSQYP
ncbi:hypothetical protein [Streptococcus agalactiae]|uniref:hypothetical protein n=1 Tax=Streptococcus agalactiae TaxID=1311 RepID=UPI00130335FA|nr:hypothetical protein [Streptococcus agalactiae]KAF0052059.1 hypothetical protein GL192_00835 [Streptococcus agalactiae]